VWTGACTYARRFVRSTSGTSRKARPRLGALTLAARVDDRRPRKAEEALASGRGLRALVHDLMRFRSKRSLGAGSESGPCALPLAVRVRDRVDVGLEEPTRRVDLVRQNLVHLLVRERAAFVSQPRRKRARADRLSLPVQGVEAWILRASGQADEAA
jgi:hypothetical protein